MALDRYSTYQHPCHGELPINYHVAALQSPIKFVIFLFDISISTCSHDYYGCTLPSLELINNFSFSLSYCRLRYSLLLLPLLLLLFWMLLFLWFLFVLFVLLSTGQYENIMCFLSTTSTALAFMHVSILIMVGWVMSPEYFEGIVCFLATQYFEVLADHALCL